MESVAEDHRVEKAKFNFGLSRRGATNLLFRDVWGPREKSMGNPWSPTVERMSLLYPQEIRAGLIYYNQCHSPSGREQSPA